MANVVERQTYTFLTYLANITLKPPIELLPVTKNRDVWTKFVVLMIPNDNEGA